MRLLRRRSALLIVVFAGIFFIACRTNQSEKLDSGLAATDAAQSVQSPLVGKGWADDDCLSCLCTLAVFPEKIGYQNVSEDPQIEWTNKVGYCGQKKACGPFEYSNVWSPILLVKRCGESDLLARWTLREQTAETLACFYEQPFFGGTEQCYKPGKYAEFDANMTNKFSSMRGFYGAQVQAWPEKKFQGQVFNGNEDWIPELPAEINNKISSFNIAVSPNRPAPADLQVSLNAAELTNEIKREVGSHGDHESFVKALLDLAYKKINAKAAQQNKRGYHIFISKIRVKVDRNFKDLAYTGSFDFKGDDSYGVFAFRSGTAILHGDGGWKNWAMEGHFERTGDRGSIATFSEHP